MAHAEIIDTMDAEAQAHHAGSLGLAADAPLIELRTTCPVCHKPLLGLHFCTPKPPEPLGDVVADLVRRMQRVERHLRLPVDDYGSEVEA